MAQRRKARRIAIGGLLTSLLCTIVVGVILFLLPANQSIFAFIDALLVMVLIASLLSMGICILVIYLASKKQPIVRQDGNRTYIQF
ncbi:hypothetical protein [Dictyobacter kobayashii]|uniref:Uncharacterized protein n=1 Tax=Dictyobacter kobayashii TaxID=2014872 RepID=A0A402AQI2_9CHLR|nr:hypothetical protein [Dictyobacter kobayashii]GCE21366.1 hypothetical protein KDK_51660 [Dictyobacter kobayashii]